MVELLRWRTTSAPAELLSHGQERQEGNAETRWWKQPCQTWHNTHATRKVGVKNSNPDPLHTER